MNIEFKLLANCPEQLHRLARLHYEELARHWVPDISYERVEQRFKEHLNHNSLPLTWVAFENNHSVGMASLRVTDGIRLELTPWLGGLVVDPSHRGKKIGEELINQTKQKAREFGFEKLYLFAFNPTLPQWYEKLGWKFLDYDQLFGHKVTIMSINL
ncbi:MAG TPA: GNAT family N-acetyltransferase [Coxiellaceae bacterium]|nr:GNAT family N-acetyltransferase [Coxiellaceae bacterium]